MTETKFSCRACATRLASVLVLAACAATAAAQLPEGFEPIAREEARLVLQAPGIDAASAAFVRRTFGFDKVVEIGTWSAPRGAPAPRAQLGFFELGGRIYFSDGRMRALGTAVTESFPGMTVTLGEQGESSNAVGSLEYHHFGLNGVMACVYVRQFAGPKADDGLIGANSGQSLGQLKVWGWYCNEGPPPLSQDEVDGFLQGIGLRGWAVP